MKNKLIDINEVKIKNLDPIRPDLPEIRKEIQHLEFAKLGAINLDRNGVYIGCERVENGGFI
ncbi:MAG TPA: hypothetical protein VK050_07525 [Flavobacteriaceae bacterium]|nr:hypothetical protein [Flavobacteriaceae bacterium]